MSIAYLKVKIKSLAAEQAIIRHEELRYRRQGRWHLKRQQGADAAALAAYGTFNGLRSHRMALRLEIRAALLAYGYLRGRRYRQIEPAPHHLKEPFSRAQPSLKRAAEVVVKFSDAKSWKEAEDKLKVWAKAA